MGPMGGSGDSLISGLQGHWKCISMIHVHLIICVVLFEKRRNLHRITVEPNMVWAVLPTVAVTVCHSRSLVVWHRVPVTSWKITAHSVAFCLDKFSGQHETAGTLLGFHLCFHLLLQAYQLCTFLPTARLQKVTLLWRKTLKLCFINDIFVFCLKFKALPFYIFPFKFESLQFSFFHFTIYSCIPS